MHPRSADPHAHRRSADSTDARTSVARPARRRRKFLLALVVSVLLGCTALELGVRYIILWQGEPIRWGWRLRRPGRWADPDEDEFWALSALLQPQPWGERPPAADPLLGWRSWAIAPETLEHQDVGEVGDRRIVLLYGDSFARCAVPMEHCWEGLLERSDLASDFYILNYGVGAYGVDQAHLLLRESLDLYSGRDPIVVFSIFVDDDLSRSILSLRDQPKPRFRFVDGALELAPPAAADRAAWVEENGTGIASYAWRGLVRGTTVVPRAWRDRLCGRPRRRQEQQVLNRAILAATKADLEARGLDYFVLLFPGRRTLARDPAFDWQEPFLLDALRELEMPFVSGRRELEESAARAGRPLADYFKPEGNSQGHYNPLGNEAVFGTLRRGLQGQFD